MREGAFDSAMRVTCVNALCHQERSTGAYRVTWTRERRRRIHEGGVHLTQPGRDAGRVC
jgi:hypothetical protein